MNKCKSIYFIQQLPQGCRQSLNSTTKTRGLCCKAKFCGEFDLLQCFDRLRWRQMDVFSYSIWISLIAAPSSRSHHILMALQWYTAGNLGSCTAAGKVCVWNGSQALGNGMYFLLSLLQERNFYLKESKRQSLTVILFLLLHFLPR